MSSNPIEVFITLDAKTLDVYATASKNIDGQYRPVNILTRVRTILPEDNSMSNKARQVIDLTRERRNGKDEARQQESSTQRIISRIDAIPRPEKQSHVSLCSSKYVTQCPVEECKNKIDIDDDLCPSHTPLRVVTMDRLISKKRYRGTEQCNHTLLKGLYQGEQCIRWAIDDSGLCTRHKKSFQNSLNSNKRIKL